MKQKIKKQHFGGLWTVEKLDIFSNYLDFYITALKNQPFSKIYIDAFAGTGSIELKEDNKKIEGSVCIALNAKKQFDQYVFIEKEKKYYEELCSVIDEKYSNSKDRITIIKKDCNEELKVLCESIDWVENRALLLLDPYATGITWETLKMIADTKAIDVWYLFSISAIHRMLPKDGQKIDPMCRAKLNAILGDSNWENKFYCDNPQCSLFGEKNKIKAVDTDGLSKYICNRLRTIFAAVADNPRILYNSKNSPLFLFCFAVSNDNPKAYSLAIKVAKYILDK